MKTNRQIRPQCDVVLKTDQDKLSRIIEIQSYLMNLIITNTNGPDRYQPNNEDEDQPLRIEARTLRVELGIIDKDGNIIEAPSIVTSYQYPVKIKS